MSDSTRPVLLAYDGSPSAAGAIAVAGRLLDGGRAVVCHVGTDPEVAVEGATLARRAGLEPEQVVEPGHRKAWRGLLEVAARTDARLVVAGAHGVSGIRPGILGSVSTALVHHARAPTLVVPGTVVEEATSGPLLLAYDGSDGARQAIATAAELLAQRRAVVFHAWESWVAEAPALAGLSGTVQGMATELDAVAGEQSAERTDEGVQAAARAGFDAEGRSERATGPLWKAVLDAADQNQCSAIVVGSRGLTGISAALGSVSNGVVHHSRRPVLVVPPG